MNILGIDPGYDRIGFAVLEKEHGREKIIFSECFQTNRNLSIHERIFQTTERCKQIISTYTIDEMALEKVYINHNKKTVLAISEVRGALVNTALSCNIAIDEYTPLQIKQAVTGYGKSDKKQVAFMVQKIITLENRSYIDDEIDAIAVALTHSASRKIRNL